MTKPVLLDLYCCAGGATRGYQQAGFTVVGVDIKRRRDYCGDDFFEGDAIDYVTRFGHLYDGIHTSPPSQERCTLTNGTNASRGWGRTHTQWVPATREALEATGKPYIIEQPQGHKGLIRMDIRLCMDMFRTGPPPWVQRHRDFEISGFTVEQPKHPKHEGYVRGMRHGVLRDGPYVAAYGNGGGKATVAEMQYALRMPWVFDREDLTEAIPPPYTEHIGKALMQFLRNSTPPPPLSTEENGYLLPW
jgi:hypothetical protein